MQEVVSNIAILEKKRKTNQTNYRYLTLTTHILPTFQFFAAKLFFLLLSGFSIMCTGSI